MRGHVEHCGSDNSTVEIWRDDFYQYVTAEVKAWVHATFVFFLLLQTHSFRSAPASPDGIRLAVGPGPSPVLHVIR